MNKNTPNRLSENKSLETFEESLPDVIRITGNNESRAAKEQEQNAACSTTRRDCYSRLSLRKFLKAFRSYLSSEDDLPLQCSLRKEHGLPIVDKEPMFVIVDSSGISNPSSREILVDRKEEYFNTDNLFTRYLNKNVIPNHFPSTSTRLMLDSPSSEEMQMFEINLQNDSAIVVDDAEDNASIVLSYLRSKELINAMEGALVLTKKKASLLENVSIPETIIEGKRFSKFPSSGSSDSTISKEDYIPSEESLEEFIPSFPGSPRELSIIEVKVRSAEKKTEDAEKEFLKDTTKALLKDQEFLIAAESGDAQRLQELIREGINVHQTDLFGRNALHLSVHSGDEAAITVVLKTGIKPTTKDDIGMTPLSICLMRRPNARIAELLFAYGAKILPRSSPMDTGIFIQFVMMCRPTDEDEKILKLLVENGALVDDPGAPGQRQALHFAAMSNNCKLIRILADLGANLFAVNHRHETPLEVAMIFKCKDAVECLTEIERKTAINHAPNGTSNNNDTVERYNESKTSNKTIQFNESIPNDTDDNLNKTAKSNEILNPNKTAASKETTDSNKTAVARENDTKSKKTADPKETTDPNKTAESKETTDPNKTAVARENDTKSKKTADPKETMNPDQTANPNETNSVETKNPNETRENHKKPKRHC